MSYSPPRMDAAQESEEARHEAYHRDVGAFVPGKTSRKETLLEMVLLEMVLLEMVLRFEHQRDELREATIEECAKLVDMGNEHGYYSCCQDMCRVAEAIRALKKVREE